MATKKAFGTKLQIETATPGTYADIAGITALRPFDHKVEIIDGSSHDSVNEFREKIAGFKDAGEVQLDINYDPALDGHQDLEEALASTKNFRIKFPGAPAGRATGQFSGIVKGFSAGAPFDGKLTASVIIDINGPITWS